MTAKQQSIWATAAVALILFTGCGGRELPDLGQVEGTVTLEGQPVSNVLVAFHAQGGGRPGTGVTDEQGHYELTYVSGELGTKLGPSRVEISMVWPDGEPTPGVEDKVPAAYQGANSKLSFDVQPGHNVYNINLSSSGER